MSSGGTKASTESRSYAASRLSDYTKGPARAKKAERDYKATIVPALAARCYHLPGNTYCQDWSQYFMNNHPVIGICFHSKHHPLGFPERLVALIGSIAFGLAITNIFFLSFIFTDEEYQEAVLSISVNKNATKVNELTGADDNDSDSSIVITYGMILLWTVGGGLHTMFDLSVWYISACACCHPGGLLERCGCLKKLGSTAVLFLVVVVVAISTFIVVLRASIESSDEDITIANITSGGLTDDIVDLGKVDGVESFEFILAFLIELAMALIVYFPLLGTILFTGILGCGRIPFLGGQPREVWLEEKNLKKSTSQDTAPNPAWEDLA